MNENDDNKREIFKNIPTHSEKISQMKCFTSVTYDGKDSHLSNVFQCISQVLCLLCKPCGGYPKGISKDGRILRVGNWSEALLSNRLI